MCRIAPPLHPPICIRPPPPGRDELLLGCITRLSSCSPLPLQLPRRPPLPPWPTASPPCPPTSPPTPSCSARPTRSCRSKSTPVPTRSARSVRRSRVAGRAGRTTCLPGSVTPVPSAVTPVRPCLSLKPEEEKRLTRARTRPRRTIRPAQLYMRLPRFLGHPVHPAPGATTRAIQHVHAQLSRRVLPL